MGIENKLYNINFKKDTVKYYYSFGIDLQNKQKKEVLIKVKKKSFFRVMEWIGFIITLVSIYVSTHYPHSYIGISKIFIFIGAILTLTFFYLEKKIKKKENLKL